jgi:hypothetical protein
MREALQVRKKSLPGSFAVNVMTTKTLTALMVLFILLRDQNIYKQEDQERTRLFAASREHLAEACYDILQDNIQGRYQHQDNKGGEQDPEA